MEETLVVGCHCTADVSNCMQRVQSLKFAEEACYNGTLLLKALSSGLDIGTCNWSITSPKQNIAYLSGSIFASEIATEFDYHALQGSDVILFSDCMAADLDKHEDDFNGSCAADNCPPNPSANDDAGSEFLLKDDDFVEQSKKLDFLCSLVLESTNAGGSVLIPISRLGLMLQLLEHITYSLQSLDLKVPIYIISSVAEELLAFLNVIPEWLCKQRQEKFYSGQGLFSFMDLLNQKRLCLFPAIHSPQLLAIWQEPCIVFCPHWSLRIGPSVHLLHHLCSENRSLLIVEEGVDVDLACLPFQPMAMKILNCSFPSGMKSQKAEALLKFLKPKYVLLPEKLKQQIGNKNQPYSFIYYNENETLRLPKMKAGTDIDIEIDLARQLSYTKMEEEDINVARTKGELLIARGKIRLGARNKQFLSSQARPLLCLGSVNLESLVMSLQKLGMTTRVEEVTSGDDSERTSLVHVVEPKNAMIEVRGAHTIISTDDESLAADIRKAMQSISNCI